MDFDPCSAPCRLAVYQEEYMREKANRMADYQRALAEQVNR